MRRIFNLIILAVFSHCLFSQTRIIPSDEQPYTAETLVQDKFIGSGVKVLSITHDGTGNSVGFFSGFMPSIGFDEGLVLSTGNVSQINSLNSGNVSSTTSNSSISDSDLEQIVGTSQIFDISRFTIEFIPLSDSISFNYIFASEEYPEFVCSQFNDIFGFFLSGPNPSGGNYNSENIALIPDPLDPSGNIFLNIPVQINTVNSGVQGENNNTDIENCESPNGSLNYSTYYNDNPIGSFPMFDGFIDPFKAKAKVIPCETYTMKIIIADVLDRDFDSGVFLEAKSFSSGFLQVETESQSIDGTLAEGCAPGAIIFEAPGVQSSNLLIDINLLDPSQFPDGAVAGLDYNNFPTQVIIPAGQSSVSVPLDIVNDNIDEGIEHIYFDVVLNQCERDTIKVAIADDFMNQVTLPGDTTLCVGDSLLIGPQFPEDFNIPPPRNFDNHDDLQIVEAGVQYESVIKVTGVTPDMLNDRYFRSVCIDTFIGRNLNDYDFFLRGPNGQLLELSTDNGFKINNDLDVDTFLNTCFTLDGVLNINNGNEFQGAIYPTNQTYAGSYLPEGNWLDLFYSNSALANGDWRLIILSDEDPDPADVVAGLPYLSAWSVNFFAEYQIYINWFMDGQPMQCPSCIDQVIYPQGGEEYVLEIQDSRGCMATDTMLVDVYDEVVPPPNLMCAGEGFTFIDISWDDIPDVTCYQYQLNNSGIWIDMPLGGLFTIENLELNTEYMISVRSKIDRCYSESVDIICSTQPCPQPTGMLVDASDSSCFLGADASLTVSANGGAGGPYTFMIQGQSNTTGVFTGLIGGPDIVVIADNIGCPFELNVDIPRPEEIELQIMADSISCFGEVDGRIEIEVNGVFPPFDIEWEDGSSVMLRENLTQGWYYVTITDDNDCEKVDSVFIEEPNLHRFISVDRNDISCFGEDDGSLAIIHFGGTPPYSYDWATGQSLRIVNDLMPGPYECTVYDSRGCTFVFQDTIIEPELIEIEAFGNEVECYFTDQGLAWVGVMGGVLPYEYLWEDGSVNDSLIATTGGDHFVTITDANGCTNIVNAAVTSPDSIPMELMFTDATCFGLSDGTATVTVTPDLDILWDDGQTSEFVTNLSAGTHCVTVTDADGCTNVRCANIGQAELIVVDPLIVNPNCGSDLNGSIEVIPGGGTAPYMIEWSDENGFLSNAPIIDDLGVGTYDLIVTDDIGCTNEFSFDLEPATQLEFSFETDTINCAGTNTGMISVIPDGGTGPFNFLWDGPAGLNSNDSLLIDVFGGTYMVTVTDALGCAGESQYDIPEREPLLVSLTGVTEVDCGGEATGGLTIEVAGGLMPYEFEWNNGLVSQNLDGVRAGVYTVIVTDALGCIESETFEIAENPEIMILTEITNVSCSGQSPGGVTINPDGGFPPFQYSFNGEPFVTNNVFAPLDVGSYEVIVQDALGCEQTLSNILIEEEFSVQLVLPPSVEVGFEEFAELFPVITGEVSGIDYKWSSPDITLLSCLDCPDPQIGPIIENSLVTLTVTNDFGCRATATTSIFVDKEVIIKVPTAFTPDNNGVNDLLNVFGRDGTTISRFDIYTRWGELVFSNTNTFMVNDKSVGWDGRYNGQLLDAGVYNYMIEAEFVDGTQKFVKGQTTLIR